MKTALFLAVLLLLTGCGGIGGGIGPTPTSPPADDITASGLRKTPTPFQPQSNAPAGAVTALPGGAPGSDFQAMKSGQSVSKGRLTFTLNQVQAAADQTVISYQIQGLPADYLHATGLDDPWIALPDGSQLKILAGDGGGGPGSESGIYSFPPLPPGTKAFTLTIPNNWAGQVTEWKIPVKLSE